MESPSLSIAKDTRNTWPRATLGSVARVGNPITIWCNNYACGYRLAEGGQYRAVLSVADLEALAERYGDEVPFVEFRPVAVPALPQRRCQHDHRQHSPNTAGTLGTGEALKRHAA